MNFVKLPPLAQIESLFDQLTLKPELFTQSNASQVRDSITELVGQLNFKSINLNSIISFIERFSTHPDWQMRACFTIFLNEIYHLYPAGELGRYFWSIFEDPDVRVVEYFLNSKQVERLLSTIGFGIRQNNVGGHLGHYMNYKDSLFVKSQPQLKSLTSHKFDVSRLVQQLPQFSSSEVFPEYFWLLVILVVERIWKEGLDHWGPLLIQLTDLAAQNNSKLRERDELWEEWESGIPLHALIRFTWRVCPFHRPPHWTKAVLELIQLKIDISGPSSETFPVPFFEPFLRDLAPVLIFTKDMDSLQQFFSEVDLNQLSDDQVSTFRAMWRIPAIRTFAPLALHTGWEEGVHFFLTYTIKETTLNLEILKDCTEMTKNYGDVLYPGEWWAHTCTEFLTEFLTKDWSFTPNEMTLLTKLYKQTQETMDWWWDTPPLKRLFCQLKSIC